MIGLCIVIELEECDVSWLGLTDGDDLILLCKPLESCIARGKALLARGCYGCDLSYLGEAPRYKHGAPGVVIEPIPLAVLGVVVACLLVAELCLCDLYYIHARLPFLFSY
jgi:hypothetical protein